MKLSVNEAKLTGLWARSCASIQQVGISLPSGQKIFRAFRKTGPWCDSILSPAFYLNVGLLILPVQDSYFG